MKDLSINSIISFNTKPTTVLPSVYKNVVYEGKVGFRAASTMEDVASKHQQIRAVLPELSEDYTKLTYILITHQSGTNEVLALEWIDVSSITTSKSKQITITLFEVPDSQEEHIRKMLALNGFTNYTINVN